MSAKLTRQCPDGSNTEFYKIDKLEAFLTLTEVINLWIDQVHEFETLDAYLSFVAERGGKALHEHEAQVRKGAEYHYFGSPKSVRHCLSEMWFKRQLVFNINSQAENLYALAPLASCAFPAFLAPSPLPSSIKIASAQFYGRGRKNFTGLIQASRPRSSRPQYGMSPGK